jgi:hypothetical protein
MIILFGWAGGFVASVLFLNGHKVYGVGAFILTMISVISMVVSES